MRVLHFYKTYKPDTVGGVENFIGELCSGAVRRGIDASVLTLSDDPAPCDMGDHMHYRAKSNVSIASTPFSVSALGEFRRHASQADLIHYHFPWPFMDVVHFASGIRKPTVVTYHSDIVKQRTLLMLYRPLMMQFLRSVSSIVATSHNYQQSSDVLRQFKDKTEIIPIGIDRAAYSEAPAKLLGEWRERVGEKFFLFVGNLRYYKGLHTLIDAVQGTPVKVVIAGSGPLEAELKAQAARTGGSNILFTGLISDLDKNALLRLCRGVVFPSHLRSEAFGISLLEGAMFGKPMVSCELGTGTSYINVDGKTGFVIQPENSSQLRAALIELWVDDARVATFGDAAVQRYEQLFTADRMIDSYMALYRRLAVG